MSNQTDKAQEKWLITLNPTTKKTYQTYFKMWLEWNGDKTGDTLIQEARTAMRKPDTADEPALKLFAFYKHLLSGTVFTKRRKTPKPLSQKTCKQAATAVQSFYSANHCPISLKTYLKKDKRMQKPLVETKKHQLVAPEIDKLFRIADIRDKAILALGLMGQDATTVAGLKIEQIKTKLAGEKLEFIETRRQKANTELLILLTPEVQHILSDYLKSIGKTDGLLFLGYHNKQLMPDQCNDVFKALCKKAEITSERQLSFHCCRKWFSSQLRSKVSDDLIDLMTGHEVRFAGAYLGDTNQIRESLTQAGVEATLRLQQSIPTNGIVKELGSQRQTIQGLIDEMAKMQKDYGETIAALKQEKEAKTLSPEMQKEAEQTYQEQVEAKANQMLQPLREQIEELQKEIKKLKPP